MSFVSPLGPSGGPKPAGGPPGSSLNSLGERITGIFSNIVYKGPFSEGGQITRTLQSSAGSTPEVANIEKSPPFITGWKCEEIPGRMQLKWTRVNTDEEIKKLNQKQFPSLQPQSLRSVTRLGISPDNLKTLKTLGFVFDKDRLDIFYSPTRIHLEIILAGLKLKHPALSTLRFIDADQILSPDQFLELMLDDVLILSKWPEIIHDLFYHIAPMLTNISRDPESYPRYKQDQKNIIHGYLQQLHESEKDEEEFLKDLNKLLTQAGGRDIDIAQWKRLKPIIKYSLGAYLDIQSSLYIEKKFPETTPLKHDFINCLCEVIIENERWQKAWTKELGLEPSEQELVSKDPNTKRIIQCLFIKAGLNEN